MLTRSEEFGWGVWQEDWFGGGGIGGVMGEGVKQGRVWSSFGCREGVVLWDFNFRKVEMVMTGHFVGLLVCWFMLILGMEGAGGMNLYWRINWRIYWRIYNSE